MLLNISLWRWLLNLNIVNLIVKNLIHLSHFNIEQWHKMQIAYISSKMIQHVKS